MADDYDAKQLEQRVSPLPSEEGKTEDVLRSCTRKSRPECGLDCLIFAMFARQRPCTRCPTGVPHLQNNALLESPTPHQVIKEDVENKENYFDNLNPKPLPPGRKPKPLHPTPEIESFKLGLGVSLGGFAGLTLTPKHSRLGMRVRSLAWGFCWSSLFSTVLSAP